jgi:hypothetical protein
MTDVTGLVTGGARSALGGRDQPRAVGPCYSLHQMEREGPCGAPGGRRRMTLRLRGGGSAADAVREETQPMEPFIATIGVFGTGPSGTVGEEAPRQERLLDCTGRRP